jgi:hypothetical protein
MCQDGRAIFKTGVAPRLLRLGGPILAPSHRTRSRSSPPPAVWRSGASSPAAPLALTPFPSILATIPARAPTLSQAAQLLLCHARQCIAEPHRSALQRSPQ